MAADFVLHDVDLLPTADSDTRVCLCYPTYTSYLLFLRNKQLYCFIQSFKDPEISFHLKTWAAVDSQVVAYVSIFKGKKAVKYIDHIMSHIISMRQDQCTDVNLGQDVKNNWAHHCCFSDGPKAVDKNVAGYVHRWTCRGEKMKGLKSRKSIKRSHFRQAKCLRGKNTVHLHLCPSIAS